MIGLMCCLVMAIAQFAGAAIDEWWSKGNLEELGESPAAVPLHHDSNRKLLGIEPEAPRFGCSITELNACALPLNGWKNVSGCVV